MDDGQDVGGRTPASEKILEQLPLRFPDHCSVFGVLDGGLMQCAAASPLHWRV
jgi:hypothetical protein